MIVYPSFKKSLAVLGAGFAVVMLIDCLLNILKKSLLIDGLLSLFLP